MQVAKVVGTVVSTKKLKSYGETRIVVDTVGAGVGELVLCVSGAASRNAVGNASAAVDAAIVGIVDTIGISGS